MSLLTYSPAVVGSRYMDDVNLGVVYIPGDQQFTRQKAEDTLRSVVTDCYDKNLTLEETKTRDETSWDYLKTTVTCGDRYPWLSCAHRVKEEALILAGLPSQLVRVVPFHSYSPDSQKRGQLIGTFCRVEQNTTYPVDKLRAVLLLRVELLGEGWPDEIIIAALDRMVSKVGGAWAVIYRTVCALTRF